jgi:hypothetical protein
MELAERKLFVGLVKARNGLLWHSDRIDSMTEAVLSYYLADFVAKSRGRMERIVGEVAPTAWCGSLLHTKIVVEVGYGLAPIFSWILEIWCWGSVAEG